jgi:transcriptional regulator with XRE-family HTH domain
MEKSIHTAQYVNFLKLFRETRIRAGITQIELAERVGQAQSFISKCERGERRIDIIELRTFCEALGTSLQQFVAVLERRIIR